MLKVVVVPRAVINGKIHNSELVIVQPADINTKFNTITTTHREVHRTSKEADWWERLGLSPLEVAHKLWRQSRGDTQPEKSTRRSAKKPARLNGEHVATRR